MRQVLVVTSAGSGVKGIYGPYAGPETAREAMARLQKLPGMSDDDWQVLPLHELYTDLPPVPAKPEDPT